MEALVCSVGALSQKINFRLPPVRAFSWFYRGLLNFEEGTTAFLEYLWPKLPSGCDFELIKSFALSNILERTNGELEWSGGPYAFDRLDDAKSAQNSGLDYSTREFSWEESGI